MSAACSSPPLALRVPFFSSGAAQWLRPGRHGHGAGGFHAPVFTIARPIGEFGAMGLEGAVRLGFRKELEAPPEGPERERAVPEARRQVLRQWRGHAHGRHAGDRRRHRPGGHAPGWRVALASARVGMLGPALVDTW